MGGSGGKGGIPGRRSDPISDVCGKRGKAKDIDSAAKDTNPNYLKGREWQQNCQRCVFAYEMQRRGYDVEAMPRIFDGSDTLPYATSYGWMGVMENMQSVQMPSRNTVKRIADTMAGFGEGARAIIRVKWKGANSGHVFMAEQTAQGTVFVDPQPGKRINIEHYMSQAVKGRTEVVRVDNLTPKPEMLKRCVKKRGT